MNEHDKEEVEGPEDGASREVFAQHWRMPTGVPGEKVRRLFDPPPAVLRESDLDSIVDVGHVIEEALANAKSIVEDARVDAESIREEARREGRVAGYEEVLVELGRVRAEAARIEKDAEKDMLELAFRVAERVLGRAIEIEPEVVVDVVSQALEHARGRRSVEVFVHPEDYPEVMKSLESLQTRIEGARLFIEPSEDVARGGCFIETEAGRIDAQLDVQLEAMRNVLVGAEE